MKLVRAYRLDDGDIFTLNYSLSIQFENELFYEVTQASYDEFMQTTWIKTGKIFTAEELNDFVK